MSSTPTPPPASYAGTDKSACARANGQPCQCRRQPPSTDDQPEPRAIGAGSLLTALLVDRPRRARRSIF